MLFAAAELVKEMAAKLLSGRAFIRGQGGRLVRRSTLLIGEKTAVTGSAVNVITVPPLPCQQCPLLPGKCVEQFLTGLLELGPG